MSSSKFAAWLRVTPPPTSLAESSAIFKHLKTQGQGRVTTFIRAKAKEKAGQRDGDKNNDHLENTAAYYTVFSRPPSIQRMTTTFEVPVYHNLPSPRDQDPFNIRGLQDRKPYPPSKTFSCRLENVGENDTYGEQIKQDNQYHGSFKVAYTDWLQEVYGETGAPPGVKQGLGQVLSEEEAVLEAQAAAERDQRTPSERPRRERKLKMNSLIDTWHEAMGIEGPERPGPPTQRRPPNGSGSNET
ncbi:hypothetical protein LTR70_005689 [Exophiala xenobiotica]|uniref:Uncharacterized protein n=1 Tax=Lithohypha guttulata TaxID=1690604 RepID=A0ABR0KDF6_9EURO|nr:hypothetical protein LTR24_004072 [Lithohypha guttulata]KAK5317684.1 hypothetical protein LTR70_005689 [Exophiala xenobiotica]